MRLQIFSFLLAISFATATSAASPAPQFTFTQDYFPGRPDEKGRFTTGTELNYLVAHEGRLWATVSCWNLGRNGPNPGAHILVKDAADRPWRVDHFIGAETVRAEFLTVLTFTTDKDSKKLDRPVKMLAAGIAARRSPPRTEVCLRDPDTGRWTLSTVTTTAERGDGLAKVGVRMLHDHVDAVTGIHHVFAGATVGEIVRGSYDPAAPGRIVWDSSAELPARESRIHSLVEVNGVLYASVGSDEDTAKGNGGLFRRVDGREPHWEWLLDWRPSVPEQDRTAATQRDLKPGLRGLTAIEWPPGSGQRILLGAREHPGVIERVELAPRPRLVPEFDVREHFRALLGGGRMGVTLVAYNHFTPFRDSESGELLHLTGAWINQPRSAEESSGAMLLIRHADGTWTHQPIPLLTDAPRASLRGCRTICVSPFPEEQGRVIYLGGFDAAGGPHRDTARIYKGTLNAK